MKEKAKYIDVTKKWLAAATPNSHELKLDNYFMSDDGIKHPIKGKEKVHSIERKGAEYERALWIKSTFGGDIHLVPRITDLTNEGLSTPTPDFRWNGSKWDLKTPGTKGKFENILERFLKEKGARRQAKKFIIDCIKLSDKTDKEIINVINKTINNRNWVEEIIIVRGKKIIKIYSKQ